LVEQRGDGEVVGQRSDSPIKRVCIHASKPTEGEKILPAAQQRIQRLGLRGEPDSAPHRQRDGQRLTIERDRPRIKRVKTDNRGHQR
jgi:hypothetical protein